MADIGTVMFFKALILGGWAYWKECQEEKKAKEAELELVRERKRQWDSACAKHPPALTYSPTELGDGLRAPGQGRRD